MAVVLVFLSLLISIAALPAQQLEVALLSAAALGDTARVEELLVAGASVDGEVYAGTLFPL